MPLDDGAPALCRHERARTELTRSSRGLRSQPGRSDVSAALIASQPGPQRSRREPPLASDPAPRHVPALRGLLEVVLVHSEQRRGLAERQDLWRLCSWRLRHRSIRERGSMAHDEPFVADVLAHRVLDEPALAEAGGGNGLRQAAIRIGGEANVERSHVIVHTGEDIR